MKNLEGKTQQTFKYWAFISYSHKDVRWAKWLQRKLETYRVPKEYIGERIAGQSNVTIPEKIFPVFLDREELPTASDLSDEIRKTLKESRFLIVICSPNSVASNWVNEEIRFFKTLGGEKRVHCLVIEDQEGSNDLPLENCFPKSVRYHVDTKGMIAEKRAEPLAADARKGKDGKKRALLKIIAALTFIDFAHLYDRESRRSLRRKILFIVSTSLSLLVLGTILYVQEVKSRREIEEHLYRSTIRLTESHLVSEENALARRTLWIAPERLRNWEWGMLLALCRHEIVKLSGHTKAVVQVEFSPDDKHVLTASEDGLAIVWDTDTENALVTLKGHSLSVNSACYSSDGKTIITSSNDKTAKI